MTTVAPFSQEIALSRHGSPEGQIRTTFRFAEDAPFFRGHFPDDPLVPGVLLLDRVAIAARLLLDGVPGTSDLRVVAVEKARFSRPVRPGETVECRVTVKPAGHNTYNVKGSVFTGADRCLTCSLVLSSGDSHDFA